MVIFLHFLHSQLPGERWGGNGFLLNRNNRVWSALALTQEDGKFPCVPLVNGTVFSRLTQTATGVFKLML